MRRVWAIVTALVLGVICVTGPASAQDASADRVALVIGNANYPDSDTPLATPVEDARAVASELQRKGFSVEHLQDLNRRTLREAADRFLDKIRPGTVAVAYFAGYGIQSARQNYLIPVDAQIWTEPDVQRDGVPLERLLTEMSRRGARASYAIIDGAHRNPFERRFRSFSTGLAALGSVPQGTAVLLSSAPGVVLRQANGPRSTFGAEFVRQLQSAESMSAQVLERTRTAVTEATRNEQMPWTAGLQQEAPAPASPQLSANTGVPAVPAPPRANPEPPASPQAPTPVSPGVNSAATPPAPPPPASQQAALPPAPRPPEPAPVPDAGAAFRTAQQAGTKQAYEDFLAKHGSGPFADQARTELARLNAAIPPPKREPQIQPYAPEQERLLKELTQRIDANPNDAVALYRRGQIYAIHGDYRAALGDFDQVVRLNPRDPEALNNRCWVRANLDELDGALADCNEALRQRPNFIDALDSRGLVNLKIGLPRRAAADYDAALKVNARHASSLYGRGMARLRMGEAAEGNSDIRQALSMDPKIADEFARVGIK
jgi:hypothetical protein